MKHKLFPLLIVFFTANFITAQSVITGLDANKKIPGAKIIRYVERYVYPAHIAFTPQKVYSADISKWMQVILKLPMDYSLKLNKEEKDNIGFTHQEYKQLYKGIPVEYGIYKAHYKGNTLESINGDIYMVDDINTKPTISSEEAILLAKNYMHADMYKWEDGHKKSLNYYPTSELMILIHNKKTYLTYKVDIYSIKPLSRKFIYVDAYTGKIITETERIHDADTPGTANTAYSGIRPIIMDFTGADYQLFETARGMETIDYNTGSQYTNATTTWSLAGLDQYALDAHWGTEMTYDYFFINYGRDGLDGAGFFLTSYVNEGPGFGNAYWDGVSAHYGDGDGFLFTTPLTTIGVVAHEMTHGLTQFTAGLNYWDESGAMNESFSDIFGLAVDKYARNIDLNLGSSWLVGAECTSGIGIRNMSNPNAFDCADTYGGTFWNNGDVVHYDSGVQNFWFYLLTMGGSGTNDIANAYSVTGIGVDDAGAIAYRNLAYYLTPASDFADSRYYSIIAAEDLFGACSPEVAAVADAWYAVGVGGPYVNTTVSAFSYGNSASCTLPASVTFNNLSFNASTYLWDFGDGNTSTLPNPTHSFVSTGTFNVTLIATGCGINGSDTFATSIVITTGSPILNLAPAQNQNISCCNGTLFDSGGPAGDYTTYEYSTAAITVPVGNTVIVDFASFYLNDWYDYVYLYDGPNAFAPMIGYYTGNTLPNGGNPIYATTNQIYVEFWSDFVPAPGFELNWQCCSAIAPSISFAGNTISVSPAFSTYQWYLNGSPIPGATAQSYDITQGGVYYCEVTEGNNCILLSPTITSTLDLDTEVGSPILIYPNPASMALFISNPLFVSGQYKISIINLLGEVIYSSLQNSQEAMVDLAAINSGSYFVKLSQDNWEITRKVIVIR